MVILKVFLFIIVICGSVLCFFSSSYSVYCFCYGYEWFEMVVVMTEVVVLRGCDEIKKKNILKVMDGFLSCAADLPPFL
jgi:hypothetical protein